MTASTRQHRAARASHPTWRARSRSLCHFWRDMGYAVGALASGIMADIFGMLRAIGVIGGQTLAWGRRRRVRNEWRPICATRDQRLMPVFHSKRTISGPRFSVANGLGTQLSPYGR